jgi:DNA-binding LacI/PurR family transcriptional regulator
MPKQKSELRTTDGGPFDTRQPGPSLLQQQALELELRRRILSGVYPPGSRLPSLENVASGIDPQATAVGASPLWSTRDAMRTTIQNLKRDNLVVTSKGRRGTTVQDPTARPPLGHNGRFIALIQNAVPFEFMSRLSHGIITHLHNRNIHTGAYVGDGAYYLLSMSSEDDCRRESNLLEQITASGIASGILLLPARQPEHDLELIGRCASRIPVVLVGAGIDRVHTIEHRIPLISHDDVQIGRQAALLVLDALKYRTLKKSPPSRIPIYLLSEDSYSAVRDRAKGFSDVMRSVFGHLWKGENHDSPDRNVHFIDKRRQNAGFTLADRLRRHAALTGHSTKPIIVCTTDLTALGVLNCLQSELRVGKNPSSSAPRLKRNQPPLAVPDQVMVMGIDGEGFGQLLVPRLASLSLDHQALGRKAAEILIDMIEGKRQQSLEILVAPRIPNEPDWRGSTAVPIRPTAPRQTK